MTDQANPAAAGDPGSRAELSWEDFEARLTAALERMALDQMADLGWQFPDPHASKPENFSRQWPEQGSRDERNEHV